MHAPIIYSLTEFSHYVPDVSKDLQEFLREVALSWRLAMRQHDRDCADRLLQIVAKAIPKKSGIIYLCHVSRTTSLHPSVHTHCHTLICIRSCQRLAWSWIFWRRALNWNRVPGTCAAPRRQGKVSEWIREFQHGWVAIVWFIECVYYSVCYHISKLCA